MSLVENGIDTKKMVQIKSVELEYDQQDASLDNVRIKVNVRENAKNYDPQLSNIDEQTQTMLDSLNAFVEGRKMENQHDSASQSEEQSSQNTVLKKNPNSKLLSNPINPYTTPTPLDEEDFQLLKKNKQNNISILEMEDDKSNMQGVDFQKQCDARRDNSLQKVDPYITPTPQDDEDPVQKVSISEQKNIQNDGNNAVNRQQNQQPQNVQNLPNTPTDLGEQQEKPAQLPSVRQQQQQSQNQTSRRSSKEFIQKTAQGQGKMDQNLTSALSMTKYYFKRLTGRKVDSRIEYLDLIMQKIKLNDDSTYRNKSQEKLGNTIWKFAYQERRIQSHLDLFSYLEQLLEFLYYHLQVLEAVFKNIKQRYKSSNNSFYQVNAYFANIIHQIDVMDFHCAKDNQPFLSQLFTNDRAKKDKKSKNCKLLIDNQDLKPVIGYQNSFHPKLTNLLNNLQQLHNSNMQGTSDLKSVIKTEIKDQITSISQKNKSRIEDYLHQVKVQRNITLDWIQYFFTDFEAYQQVYNQNIQAVLNQTPTETDIYNCEFKLQYDLNNIIKQQRQYGLYTSFLIDELQRFELERTEVLTERLGFFSREYGKFVTFILGFQAQFEDKALLQEIEESYQINNLLPSEHLDILRRITGNNEPIIPKQLYQSFASNFQIPPRPNEHPLILKTIELSRDVAWERSLSLGEDFISSKALITVDGNILFFDQDIQEEPTSANRSINLLMLEVLQKKGEKIVNLKITRKGRFMNKTKKQKIVFNDDLDKENLLLLITYAQ